MPSILRSSWFYYTLAGLLALAGLVSSMEFQVPPRPVGEASDIAELRQRDDLNVVFVLVDTLRADRLGSYGYERPTSPVMDQLAETGIRFANVRAQSTWTKSSMAALWTGVQPFAAGITRFDDAVAESAELPAERLKAAGFRTAGFYRNAWIAPNFGFAQGFDFYLFPTPNLTEDRLQQNSPSVSSLQGSDYDVTEVALEFLEGHGHERFFLYLHLMDVHQYQYEEESALFGTSYADAYDNAIHWTDRNIGLLVAALIEADLFDETILVIASDHGEEFQEHGGEGHARTLYVETTRTPLLVSLPFAIENGVVVEEWVENSDLFPTLFDMLGLEPLAYNGGQSLVPLIEAAARGGSEGAVARRPVMSQIDRSWGRANPNQPLASITRGTERLIFDPEHPEKAELYDLAADPGEQNDLAAERPDRVAALLAEGAERFAQRSDSGIAESVEVDELQLQQLRALGYVVDGK